MESVKCYGGPLHGKTEPIESNRWGFQWVDRGLFRDRDLMFRRLDPRELPPLVQQISYTVRQFEGRSCDRDRRLVAQRRVRVAVVDGCNLTPFESRELERQLETVPWEWAEPSILSDFDEWWRWTMYRRHRNASLETARRSQAMDSYGPWFDT